MSVELSEWETYANTVICGKMRLAMRAHLLYAFKKLSFGNSYFVLKPYLSTTTFIKCLNLIFM